MSKKIKPYEMDDLDRELLAKVRKAVEYDDNGDPVRDVVDEIDMIDAMCLLVQIVDAGCAQ